MRSKRSQCTAMIEVSKYNRERHQCPFQTSGNSDLCGSHLRSKRLREAKAAARAEIEKAMVDLVTFGAEYERADSDPERIEVWDRIKISKNVIRAGLK